MNHFAMDESLREAGELVGFHTLSLEWTEGMDGTPATVLLPPHVRADLAFFQSKGEVLMWWGSSSWWAGDLGDVENEGNVVAGEVLRAEEVAVLPRPAPLEERVERH